MKNLITSLLSKLSHPLTRGIELDNPYTTEMRRQILRDKPFLTQIYEYWYRLIIENIPSGTSPICELGSGAGFFDRMYPGVITSEIIRCNDVKIVLDGQWMPFRAGSLKAIVMTDVLHHIPNAKMFFNEATRCIHPGGVILMVEPWNTAWSRWVFTHLHHEGFNPASENWELNPNQPLSGANGALPWIIFSRDISKFAKDFPMWDVELIMPIMPISYLLSGGLSTKISPPGWSFKYIHTIEQFLQNRVIDSSMFAFVKLIRL